MDNMKVEIVSSEIIKPSFPTPQSLRIYKMSLLEQMFINSPYVSIILFYDGTVSLNRLKKSLSRALNHDYMYPLAGRVRDAFSIECGDQGALFVETRIDKGMPMSTMIHHPKLELLSRLLPPDQRGFSPRERVLLAVQVNRFPPHGGNGGGVGGTAIGVSVSHCIADAAALASFLTNWAALARGGDEEEHGSSIGGEKSRFVVDCTAIFPPRDFEFLMTQPPTDVGASVSSTTTKGIRFVFDGSKVAMLKQRASNNNGKEFKPSRVEALSAFLWSNIMKCHKNPNLQVHIMCSAMNLRNRVVTPQLPPYCIGSISQFKTMMWSKSVDGDGLEMDVVARKIHEAIRKVDDEEVKTVYGGEQFYEMAKKVCQGAYEVSSSTHTGDGGFGLLLMSSWCRFPFYEIDFGFGKPVWASMADLTNDKVMFMDAIDGEGIEAWVSLPKEEMEKLEQDPNFLSYVSSYQIL